METVVQPRCEAGFSRAEIDVGHTDLGKSQIAGRGSQVRQHTIRIDDFVIHPLFSFNRPLPILETRSLTWPDEAACAATARRMAARPALRQAVIELQGTLGAGKTSFVRHLLRAAGVDGRVKSPSYAVVEPYEIAADGTGWRAWHFDFYRFNDPHEWEDAGFRDIFAEAGLKLSEWPEKAAGLLPAPDLHIVIEIGEDEQRQVTITANTPLGLELLP